MSIAPFLPGLLVPTAAPESGTATEGQPGAQPGADGEAAFMDALAAALAVQPAVVASPPLVEVAQQPSRDLQPVAAVVAPEASPVAGLETGRQAALLDLRPAPADSAVVPVELGVVTADPSTSPSPTTARETATVGAPVLPAGQDAPVGPAVPKQDTDPQPADDVRRPDASASLPSSPGAEPASTAATSAESVTNPSSTGTNPSSAVAGPHSIGTTPSSIGTNPSPVERAVVQQVFPEVTRLVSSGNGTHRITLTLQPEQLGEVKVTLVVRDGAVQVRMSGEAGDGAVRHALSSGAPELQRMLERAGATEARVLVRDPFNPAPLTAPPAPARNDFGQTWSGSSDHQQPGQSGAAHDFGQSRGESREGQPGQPGQHFEQGGHRAPVADVVPGTTPTPGRLDRNL